MPAGEAFSAAQRHEIEKAIRYARDVGNLEVSVYVGDLGGDERAQARELHSRFADAAGEVVLVAVDPGAHHLEIVTGAQVHRRLDDRACSLAAASMSSAFAVGDLAGGLVTGVQMLGDHARVPKVLHVDELE